MTSTLSISRHDKIAVRITRRLGLWPGKEFATRLGESSSSSTSFLLAPRSDLEPPTWSIQTLESLNGLVKNFDIHRFQAQRNPRPPHPTTWQGVKLPADKSLLAACVFQALTEAVDMRIKKQTKTTRKGSEVKTTAPARSYLANQDVEAVRDKYDPKYDPKRNSSSSANEEGEGCDGEIVVREEQDGGDVGSEEEYDGLEDENTRDDEGNNTDDPDYSGSDDSGSTREGSSPSEDIAARHGDSETSSRDQHVASDGTAREASLSAPGNRTSTATGEGKTITNATTNNDSETIHDVNLCSPRQSQSSSSRPVQAAAPAPSALPSQLTPQVGLDRHQLPGRTRPASDSQPSFSPNKRQRLSVEPGNRDTGGDLADNSSGCSNTHVMNMSPGSHLPREDLQRAEASSLNLDDGDLSTIAAIRQRSKLYDMSVTVLQDKISEQRDLNAAYEKTIVRATKKLDNASKMVESSSQRLAEKQKGVEDISLAQEIFRDPLERIAKNDATRLRAESLRKLIDGFKEDIIPKEMELRHVQVELAYLRDQRTCFEKARATAIERHDHGVKATVALVSELKNAADMKNHWDSVAKRAEMRPDNSPVGSGNESVAGETLHEARLSHGD